MTEGTTPAGSTAPGAAGPRLHRMPIQFGPMPGPRESPDGGRFAPDTERRTVRVSVPFRSEAAALEAVLPDAYVLDGEPVARFEASYMTGIPWLAGRDYNTFGLTIPARWEGQESVAGDFVAVLFENLADPIISGREELGWNKLWCELPQVERLAGSATCRAAWQGFEFARLAVTGLERVDLTSPASPAPVAGPAGAPIPARPRLGYKYVPRTGEWGEADVAYATLSPVEKVGARVVESWRGRGEIDLTGGRWEDLPTLFRVVAGLADLPRLEVLPATLSVAIGSGDLYETRRLR
jgi:hypothetical protein